MLRKFIYASLTLLFATSCFSNNIQVNAYSINNENIVNVDLLNTTLCNLPQDIVGHKTVVVNDKIYTIGGEDDQGNQFNQIYVYNKEFNVWDAKTSMPTPRSYFSVEVFGDFIYCIGGFQNGIYLNVVEVYDTINDTWITKQSMPHSRARFSSGIVDGYVYCIGGKTDIGYIDTVDVYNIELDKWESKSSLPNIALGDTSSATLGDNIYVFGGNDGSKDYDTVNIYNTKDDSWSAGKSMITSRSSFSTFSIGNNIYCLGGLNTSNVLDAIEVYNISADTWVAKDSMPTKLHSFSSYFKEGVIYTFGGANDLFTATSKVLSFTINKTSLKSNATSSSNIDVYIVPQNILSMSLNTNQISFEDFDGVEDMELKSALDLHVESTLPYDLYASLESEISNSDNSSIVDKLILSIKESSSNAYQNFVNIKDPILLKGDNEGGTNIHKIDMKLNKDVPYKVDIYKTSIKFEVIQK